MEEYYTSSWWRPSDDRSLFWSPADIGLGVNRKFEKHVLICSATDMLVSQYNPLIDYPNLYLEFIRLPLGREALEPIAKFANLYGPLGADLVHAALMPGDSIVHHGELADHWLREIVDLRDAVYVWQLARRGKTKELREHIEWTSRAVIYRSDNRSAVICSKEIRAEVYDAIKKRKRELVVPAMLYVQNAINKSLLNRSRSFMFSDFSDLKNPTMRSGPKGLIGALWLQFANDVHARKVPAQCGHCRRVYVPTRSDARYCSNSCRQKAYNQRRGL